MLTGPPPKFHGTRDILLLSAGHWLLPGMQFMPVAARVKIVTHWPLARTRPVNAEEAHREVLWTELAGITDCGSTFRRSPSCRRECWSLSNLDLIVVAAFGLAGGWRVGAVYASAWCTRIWAIPTHRDGQRNPRGLTANEEDMAI